MIAIFNANWSWLGPLAVAFLGGILFGGLLSGMCREIRAWHIERRNVDQIARKYQALKRIQAEREANR